MYELYIYYYTMMAVLSVVEALREGGRDGGKEGGREEQCEHIQIAY